MFILHSKFGSKLASNVLFDSSNEMITKELLDVSHIYNKQCTEQIGWWLSSYLMELVSLRLAEVTVMEDLIMIGWIEHKQREECK